MQIALIVAADEAHGIGKAGGIPWKVRSDLQRFKRLTMGHVLVIGRRTWESIGRPLPGRRMVVVTRQPGWQAEDVWTASSFPDALATAKDLGEELVFIGGGAQVFALALPLAQRLHWTRIHTLADCDTFFPTFDNRLWRSRERLDLPAGGGDEFASTYCFLERRAPGDSDCPCA